jgi:hypothetical protein
MKCSFGRVGLSRDHVLLDFAGRTTKTTTASTAISRQVAYAAYAACATRSELMR